MSDPIATADEYSPDPIGFLFWLQGFLGTNQEIDLLEMPIIRRELDKTIARHLRKTHEYR